MAKRAIPFVPSGFFAFRTPLLPFSEPVAWSGGLEAPAVADDALRLEGALARDRQQLRARLVAAVARPEVREAIFVASPSTDASIEQWLAAPDSEYGQKVERTLVRYFSRMTSRSTPFGLFSGCSIGTVGTTTRLMFGARASYQRHTRLDMEYLCKLTDALATDPGVAAHLRYRPNTSLYSAAGRLRYAEARVGDVRSYELVAVEPNELVDAMLARAAAAPDGTTAAELAEALVALDGDITLEAATGFIAELVAAQILVAELAPCVTGPEPIHSLVSQLRRHDTTAAVARELERTRDALAAIDAAGLGASPRAYHDVARGLEALPCAVELPRLFQVDMVKPAPEATLGTVVVDAITSAVMTLQRIAPTSPPGPLDRFRDAFEARFEQQEVPLLVALDDEAGIGYGQVGETAPLLDGIPFESAESAARPFEPRHAVLLAKLDEARARGAREIVLGEADLVRLENPSPPPLPPSFSVMATLAARSAEAIAAGDFCLYFKGASWGLSLLGRFCHADPVLHARVAAHLREEERATPDAIVAEIVHLPEGRIGNVISRPVLRDYEITYLGRSGAPADRQILVNDLLVSIGPGRQLVLRSRTLGTRVIPRMTNAHNFSARSIGVYRFLCDLGRQGQPFLGLDWGPLALASYRPRVRVGNVVLALETWRIARGELEPLGAARGVARFRAVQQLRARHALPRFVAVVDGDNVLPVDLDNVLGIESFVHLVKGRKEVLLEELAPGADELCAEGPEGRFCHELVVPMLARELPAAVEQPPRAVVDDPAQRADCPVVRAFPPGSEWLYAKLYTGNATADHVLQAMRPLVDDALASGAADAWFFVRYADPDWHIRLRLHGSPARLAAEVLPALHAATAPLVADGRVWKLQLDTYVREVERYGGAQGIALAERWFDIDSRTALGIVELLDGDAGNDARWRLALRGIDQLLDDLGFDLEAKRAIVRRARDGFAAELAARTATTKALGDTYRRERAALEVLLDRAADASHPLAPGLALIGAASPRVREIGHALRDAERAGRLTLPVANLAASYMHMLANRLLKGAARRQELVVYDLLDRCYTSRAKRGGSRSE